MMFSWQAAWFLEDNWELSYALSVFLQAFLNRIQAGQLLLFKIHEMALISVNDAHIQQGETWTHNP